MNEWFVPDAWLSRVSGWPCYRHGHAGTSSADSLRGVMATLAGGGDAFFYAKLGVDRITDVTQLGRAGFVVVDTNVTLEWSGSDVPVGPAGDVVVVDALPAQHAALQDIAARSFRCSRFHLDPLFPNETANLIKRKWTESYCLGKRGTALYAAQVDGKPAGFLAAIETTEGVPSAAIDLVGVAPEYQGRGVGTALVMHFIERWRGRVVVLRVGTQIVNIPSLSLYERCGFRSAESAYVLHAHYRNGAVCQ